MSKLLNTYMYMYLLEALMCRHAKKNAMHIYLYNNFLLYIKPDNAIFFWDLTIYNYICVIIIVFTVTYI